jgi:hypothetical protein
MTSLDYLTFRRFSADAAREARIRMLGALICSPTATRLWRIVCHAAQRELIRGRSPQQVAAIEQKVLRAIALQERARV